MNDDDFEPPFIVVDDPVYIKAVIPNPARAKQPAAPKPVATPAPTPAPAAAPAPAPTPEPKPAAQPTEEPATKPTDTPNTDRAASWWGDKAGRYNWNASSNRQFGGSGGASVVGRGGTHSTAYDQESHATREPDDTGDTPGRPPLPVSPGADEYHRAATPTAPAAPQQADVGAAKPATGGFFSSLFRRKAAAQPSLPNAPSAAPAAPATPAPDPAAAAHIQDYAKNGPRAAAFKSWFGDWESEPHNASKVVHPQTGEPQPTYNLPHEATAPGTGAAGRPITVYHGTPNGPFHAFDKAKIANPDQQLFGPGFYFTEDQKAAEVFARGGHSASAQGQSPTVMSYYLNARKPFDIDKHSINPQDLPPLERASVRAAYVQKALVEDGRDAAAEAAREFDSGAAQFKYRELTSDKGKGGLGASKTAIQGILQKHGFDSLTVQADDVPNSEPGKNRYWIVFEPNQAKSTQNQGTFDSSTPHVLKALQTRPAPCAIALASRLTGVPNIRTRAQAIAAYTKSFESSNATN